MAVGDVARTLRGVVDPEAAYQRLLIDSGQAAYNKARLSPLLNLELMAVRGISTARLSTKISALVNTTTPPDVCLDNECV